MTNLPRLEAEKKNSGEDCNDGVFFHDEKIGNNNKPANLEDFFRKKKKKKLPIHPSSFSPKKNTSSSQTR